METALKIQETTYIGAKAFAISDFYHGPLAMVQKETPVILYGPKGQSLEEANSLIDRLEGTNADILVISDDYKIRSRSSFSLKIPVSGSDIVTPFYNAAAAQMFDCHLTLAKGNNPDQPRKLHKVTLA